MPGQLNFSLQLGGGFSMFQALLQLFPKKGTTGEYLLESILSDMTGQRAKKREHNWTLQFNFEVGFNPAGSVWVPSPKLWYGSPWPLNTSPTTTLVPRPLAMFLFTWPMPFTSSKPQLKNIKILSRTVAPSSPNLETESLPDGMESSSWVLAARFKNVAR